tara:strand:+ start:5092 stop:5460 length:369 start_codon:yes stop_codon:yes gene_type:complete
MKQIIIGALVMLFSNLATASDTFEIVSVKFKDGVNIEEQKRLMRDLNNVVKKFEGFKSRDYYYSSENGRWIDFVVWSNIKMAKKASEQVMTDPIAGAAISKMDQKDMIFSHYERVGGAKTEK